MFIFIDRKLTNFIIAAEETDKFRKLGSLDLGRPQNWRLQIKLVSHYGKEALKIMLVTIKPHFST